jgi:hypothetical protein
MTKRVTLPSSTAVRAARFLRLLGSDKTGEVVAATTALKQALRRAGTDLHALADLVEYGASQQTAPGMVHQTGGWRSDLAACKTRAALLAEDERKFISTISWRREPTAQQQHRLRDIALQLRSGG